MPFQLPDNEYLTKLEGEPDEAIEIELFSVDEQGQKTPIGRGALGKGQIREDASTQRIEIKSLDGATSIGDFYTRITYVNEDQEGETQKQIQQRKEEDEQNQKEIYRGDIVIKQIRAYMDHDQDVLGQDLSQYAVIRLGSEIKQTKHCVGGGPKPAWSERVYLRHFGKRHAQIQIWRTDGQSTDNCVAEGVLDLKKVAAGGKFPQQHCKLFNRISANKEEMQQVGDAFIDLEYIFDQEYLKMFITDPPKDKKDIQFRDGPTQEDLKKKELYLKRKELMKPNLNLNKDYQLPPLKNTSSYSTKNLHKISQQQSHSNVFSVNSPTSEEGLTQLKQYPVHNRSDVFGWGFSNQLSASILKHSVPGYTLPQADRFVPNNAKILVKHVKDKNENAENIKKHKINIFRVHSNNDPDIYTPGPGYYGKSLMNHKYFPFQYLKYHCI